MAWRQEFFELWCQEEKEKEEILFWIPRQILTPGRPLRFPALIYCGNLLF